MYDRFLLLSLFLLILTGCDHVESSESSVGDDGPTPRTEFKEDWNVGACTSGGESNHSLFVVDDALEVFRAGDVLYTFSPDGICAGKSDPFAGENFALAVWGDDSMTEAIDGLRADEEIVLVLVSTRFSRPARIFVSQVSGPSTYVPDGITIIRDLGRE